mmetsp:Transcript_19778/g.25627  ORF Transcript_19778/g.25627 Transcript_19778/m.25627 type:complete len:368 (+) Transcript_19778:120-1223(+)
MNNQKKTCSVRTFLLFVSVCLVLLSLTLSFWVVEKYAETNRYAAQNSLDSVESENVGRLHIEEPSTVSSDKTRTFLPGSLEGLSRTEVVRKCYVDPQRYAKHFLENICTFSPNYNLFYFLLPKSGSSTGRHVMKYSFDAKEHSPKKCRRFIESGEGFDVQGKKPLTTVSLRNPLSRFYASYDEMHVRRLGKPDRIPAKYNAWMKDYKDWTYDQYKELFETKEGVRKITRSFEKFVNDYDGYHPFDVHLNLQAPALAHKNGKIYPFDIAFDTHDMGNALKDIAKKVGAPPPEIIRGRSYPRRINTSDISPLTLRKICQLSAIDFCCLNYPLPTVCLDDEIIPIGERVRCRWIDQPSLSDEPMIEAVLI